MILLWLLCAGAVVTGQDPCSSPGDFPSPKLSLSISAAQVGDSVSVQCSLHQNILADLIIFCQDGKEVSSQKARPGQSLYQYAISVQSSAQFRCMYQYRNNQKQVNNSRLSLPRTLNVTAWELISSNSSSSEAPPSQEGAGVTEQEFCSSPGKLSAPRLFLSTTSPQEGELVSARCADLPNPDITHIVFCKDRVELSSQKINPGQISSMLLLKISLKSTGYYSCGYQHKDGKNQVANSALSTPLQVNVTERKAPPEDSPVTGQPEKTSTTEGPKLILSTIPSPQKDAGVTDQRFCSSPGHLSAPRLFLSTTSAQDGEPVSAQCEDLPNSDITHIVFCKDGVELSSQKIKPGQTSYTLLLKTSMQSAGRYSCGYQHKDGKKQVASSALSAPLQLKVTERNALPHDSHVTRQPEKTPGGQELVLSTVPSPEDLPTQEDPDMSPFIWILRSTLVLLLLVSSQIITMVLKRKAIAQPEIPDQSS